jgi:hypothetical protein
MIVDDGSRCAKCGGDELAVRWQTFANGTRHVRATCLGCGAFVRWEPQTPVVVAEADANATDDAAVLDLFRGIEP